MSRKKPPAVAPVKAIFQDVLPAHRRDLPSWLNKQSAMSYLSSLPPHSAAALLHSTPQASVANATQDRVPADSSELNDHPGNQFEPVAAVPSTTADLRDSWRPPSSTPFERKQLLERELDELRHSILGLKMAESSLLEQITPQVLRLACLIAQRVVKAEAFLDPALPLRLVQDGLSALNHEGSVSILLGSGFASAADNLRENLESSGLKCEIEVLNAGPLYACQVRSSLGQVDNSLEARLDQIVNSLLDDKGDEKGEAC